MWMALLLVAFVAVSVGLYFYFRWFKSDWRCEQIASIKRLDRLIARVADIADTPDSDLSRELIGDLENDWQVVSNDLRNGYSVKEWLTVGRPGNIDDDHKAKAIWTLAVKHARPLLIKLRDYESGPVGDTMIDEIMLVLSTDLDGFSRHEVTLNYAPVDDSKSTVRLPTPHEALS